ncbi:hypothetical protein LOK49_LG15G00869 [Camellia lanceoleosa]|uniref:Uncharacterized protein n=1 Tax=Camellia lanceoleosa TaxID=1840588 RepID=A0ACC0F510_9ERIC|nr:hypothetical protein LOK49_LG15G00869 [Camellia lanceoleosa]
MSQSRDTSILFNITLEHVLPLPPRAHLARTSVKTATDKEGKRIKKEQEEEKGKQVSKAENASSSTPLEETTTETEGSDKGNVDLLPINKLTTCDDDDVIPQSTPG